jgi:5'-hydroxyaverantin dehydrogenase
LELDVNIIGVVYTTKLALHYFRLPPKAASSNGSNGHANGSTSSQKKAIVLIGSMAGYTHLPGASLYHTSKFGVRGFFKGLRMYTPGATPSTRINMIAPIYMDTPMTHLVTPGLSQAGYKLGSLNDAVDAVCRLAADESINGRSVCVGCEGLYDLEDDNDGLDKELESLDFDTTKIKIANGKMGSF